MWRWRLQYGFQIVGSFISSRTIMHFVLQLTLFMNTESYPFFALSLQLVNDACSPFKLQ